MMAPFEQLPSLIGPTLLLCLKAILLSTAALSLKPLLEHVRSSQRHRIWVVLLLGLLLLPGLSYLLPSWNLVPANHPALAWCESLGISLQNKVHSAVPEAIPQAQGSASRATQPLPSGPETRTSIQGPEASLDAGTTPPVLPPPTTIAEFDGSGRPTGGEGLDLVTLVALLWLVGITCLLVRLGIGHALVMKAIRSARNVERDPDFGVRVARLVRRTGWRGASTVEVLSSCHLGPATYGFWRPKILLPESASDWDDERLKVVLLHELSHVRRRDWLVGQLANLTAALYWLLPQVWLARRQLEIEQERACDDAVIEAGIRPSAYATHLLSLATQQHPRALSAAAPSMAARNKQLEIRMLSILEPKPRSRVAATLALASFAVAIPVLAAVQASSSTSISAFGQDPDGTSELPAILSEIEEVSRLIEEEAAGIRHIELESEAVEREMAAAEELGEPYFEELEAIERELAPEMERAMAEIESRLEPYALELEQLQSSLEFHHAEMETLHHELEESMRAVEESLAREHESALAEREARLEEAAAALEPLHEELTRLHEEQRRTFEAELQETAEQRREELAKRRDEVRRQVEERQRELERRHAEMREHHERMRPLMERHAERLAASEPVRERLRELEERMRPKREEMERVARQMEEVHRQNSHEMREIQERLNERMRDVHSRLEPAMQRMREIQIDMEPVQRELEAFHERLAPLQRRLDDAHRRLDKRITEEIGYVVDDVIADTLTDVALSETTRRSLVAGLRRHLSLEISDGVVTLHGSRRELEQAALEVLGSELGKSNAEDLARALADTLARYESGRHV